MEHEMYGCCVRQSAPPSGLVRCLPVTVTSPLAPTQPRIEPVFAK
jgi:hypothetical protein